MFVLLFTIIISYGVCKKRFTNFDAQSIVSEENDLYKNAAMRFVFQINIACRKTRLESLSLAENCFASPRKYRENGKRFFVSYGRVWSRLFGIRYYSNFLLVLNELFMAVKEREFEKRSPKGLWLKVILPKKSWNIQPMNLDIQLTTDCL